MPGIDANLVYQKGMRRKWVCDLRRCRGMRWHHEDVSSLLIQLDNFNKQQSCSIPSFPSSRAALRAMSCSRLRCAPAWPHQGCAQGQQQQRTTKCDSTGATTGGAEGEVWLLIQPLTRGKNPRQKYKQGIQASQSKEEVFTRWDLEILDPSGVRYH